jgi:hypothetical protein
MVDNWRRAYTSRRRRALRAWGMPVLNELMRLEQSLGERLPKRSSSESPTPRIIAAEESVAPTNPRLTA